MLDKIRILLAIASRVPCESLRDLIQRQNDMEVVGEVLDPVKLLLAAGETHADVVIVESPSSDQEPGICSHLLAEYPQLLILVLSPECGSALLYQRRISKEQIANITDEEVLAAIRRALLDITS